ncbi:MAG: hypothetical protein EA390_00730 [Balneolaceae bacterium]|nr:MAG: hypothetical protein EA390_00730 [Balneolaceae bacterium]
MNRIFKIPYKKFEFFFEATSPLIYPRKTTKQNRRVVREVLRQKERGINPAPDMKSILYRGTSMGQMAFPATPRINHSVDPNLHSGTIDFAFLPRVSPGAIHFQHLRCCFYSQLWL